MRVNIANAPEEKAIYTFRADFAKKLELIASTRTASNIRVAETGNGYASKT
jgi:hypothetical protein